MTLVCYSEAVVFKIFLNLECIYFSYTSVTTLLGTPAPSVTKYSELPKHCYQIV